MALSDQIDNYLSESIAAAQSTALAGKALSEAAERLTQAVLTDAKVLACGAGRSSGSAQQLVSLMLAGFERERPGLAAMALQADAALLATPGGGDDFDLIYSSQVYALGRAGDILVVFATEAEHAALSAAINAAHDRQMTVIAFTGSERAGLVELLAGDDIQLGIPMPRPALVQQGHMILIHALIDALDYLLLGGDE
ncbi:SIS domain-containing protein [Chitinibacteraceae bacterium HSL-7]